MGDKSEKNEDISYINRIIGYMFNGYNYITKISI